MKKKAVVAALCFFAGAGYPISFVKTWRKNKSLGEPQNGQLVRGTQTQKRFKNDFCSTYVEPSYIRPCN